jgi:hypothetical protein
MGDFLPQDSANNVIASKNVLVDAVIGFKV